MIRGIAQRAKYAMHRVGFAHTERPSVCCSNRVYTLRTHYHTKFMHRFAAIPVRFLHTLCTSVTSLLRALSYLSVFALKANASCVEDIFACLTCTEKCFKQRWDGASRASSPGRPDTRWVPVEICYRPVSPLSLRQGQVFTTLLSR